MLGCEWSEEYFQAVKVKVTQRSRACHICFKSWKNLY